MTPAPLLPCSSPPPASRLEKHGEGDLTLHYTDGTGAAQSLKCGLVMMATGRKPRVDGIGLEVRVWGGGGGGWGGGGGVRLCVYGCAGMCELALEETREGLCLRLCVYQGEHTRNA